MERAILFWFRNDLRISDHPALAQASQLGEVIPCFVWAPEEEGEFAPGAASRWWLHQSLKSLRSSIQAQGSDLGLYSGPTVQTLLGLVKKSGATAVCWTKRYDPRSIRLEEEVTNALKEKGVEVLALPGALLVEPWEIQTSQKKPYQVFTPYSRKVRVTLGERKAGKIPGEVRFVKNPPASLELESLEFLSEKGWDQKFYEHWTPGEEGAKRQWKSFCQRSLSSYADGRNLPWLPGTSRLSAHLHFGEISVHHIWTELDRLIYGVGNENGRKSIRQFQNELLWREFAHHLIYHFPHTVSQPLRATFSHFPWARDRKGFRAWSKGQTGYPIVDAGMRELWATGWMHNRVRMIVASFLVKNLLISWTDGARWFWDTLVDADLANNTLGWQWTSGCGADAAPYFRIFNPILQGKKFDAKGDYVRRWVPELAKLPTKWIHHPWECPTDELSELGIRLGKEYPFPCVDHAEARDRALDAYDEMKTLGK